jgi:hypothetical protein
VKILPGADRTEKKWEFWTTFRAGFGVQSLGNLHLKIRLLSGGIMIRHAYVLLLSSAVALAQTQAPSQNQTSTQTQAAAQPAQTNGQQQQGQPSSDRPYYDYDGKPKPAPLVQPAVPGPDAITVPEGTKIPLRLENAISTKSARPGDGVYLRTVFPVTVDNTMVIPVGTYVQGVHQGP